MRLGYDLTTEQSQRLIMSPVLLQSLRILAMNAQDLGDFAGEALLANPVLEEESPYKEGLQAYLQEYYAASGRSTVREAGTSVQSGDALWQAAMQDADGQPDLAGILRRQLGLTKADDLVRSLCDYLIDSLDDGGYLTVTVEETVALGKGAIPRGKVEEALALLRAERGKIRRRRGIVNNSVASDLIGHDDKAFALRSQSVQSLVHRVERIARRLGRKHFICGKIAEVLQKRAA